MMNEDKLWKLILALKELQFDTDIIDNSILYGSDVQDLIDKIKQSAYVNKDIDLY